MIDTPKIVEIIKYISKKFENRHAFIKEIIDEEEFKTHIESS